MDFYHVLSRGVDGRPIVKNDRDRARFLHDLYAFNDSAATPNYILSERHAEERTREPLVSIHAFCLMGNHYHLLMSPVQENGISLFIQKLNMGYTKYFNEKYDRVGTLWQGKHKKILLERDAHFLYLPYYIHLNPLDFAYPEWRQGRVRDVTGALAYLNHYRWSSYLDYCGVKNFPSISSRDFFQDSFGDAKKRIREIRSIISTPALANQSIILEN